MIQINEPYNENALTTMLRMEDKSIDSIVTSPPYWKQRDYKTLPQKYIGWTGELGQEPTIELYIKHLILIFTECKRVLKDTGTLWVNLGDTYNNGRDKSIGKESLCNIPSRFRIAMTDQLQLIQRNNIIWYKPNSMPSSANNRFTVDFEDIFLFVKQSEHYWEEQLEPYTKPMNRWAGDYLKPNGKSEWDKGTGQTTYRVRNMRPNPDGKKMRCVWEENTVPSAYEHCAMYPEKLVARMIKAGCPPNGIVYDPFAGAGTTAVTALKLGRKFIASELLPKSYKIIKERTLPNLNQLI